MLTPFELWAGVRLALEKKNILGILRQGAQFSVSAVPFGPGIDIWRSCRFAGALMRSLCTLPGGKAERSFRRATETEHTHGRSSSPSLRGHHHHPSSSPSPSPLPLPPTVFLSRWSSSVVSKTDSCSGSWLLALFLPPRRWRNSWWKCHGCPRRLVFLCRRLGIRWWKCWLSRLSQSSSSIVEQNADIPVHGGVGHRAADLQGFLLGQSPTARVWLDGGSLEGFPHHRVQQRIRTSLSPGMARSSTRGGATSRTIRAGPTGTFSPRITPSAVKVPQIQFFDDKVAGQFQISDKIVAGLVMCNDSCRSPGWVQYIDKLLMCSWSCSGRFRCTGTLLCNARLDSEYMFCVGSWVLLAVLPIFSKRR